MFAMLAVSASAEISDKGDDEYRMIQETKAVKPQLTADSRWKPTIGVLQETENVEGSGDKDGFYEPTVFFNITNGKWTFGITNYNENHSFEYSDWTRGDYLNRTELSGHYKFLDTDNYAVGLGIALRNYQWIHKDSEPSSTNNRWLNIQPDWRYSFTDKISYEGWLGFYNMFNNGQDAGYTDKELETESGIVYKLNDTVSIKLNYYLDRGWNLGETSVHTFNNQQIRGYVPVTLKIFDDKNTVVTPYFRQTVYNASWDEDNQRENKERDTRLGIRLDQELPAGFAISLEYAYEMRDGVDTAPGTKDFNKYHYTGVGINYTF